MVSERNYDVYFEIFGKKMKTKIMASSQINAEQKVRDELKIHKVELKKNDEFNEIINIFDKMDDFLSGLKKK